MTRDTFFVEKVFCPTYFYQNFTEIAISIKKYSKMIAYGDRSSPVNTPATKIFGQKRNAIRKRNTVIRKKMTR